ncbi:MAG TPA: ATP-binding protein [Frankiaceae bacterium]
MTLRRDPRLAGPAALDRRDRALLQSASRRIALQSAAVLAVVVAIAVVGLAVTFDRAQHGEIDRTVRSAARTADDVGDPPPGVLLVEADGGRVSMTPGAPAGLARLAQAPLGPGGTSAEGRIYQTYVASHDGRRFAAAYDLTAHHQEEVRLLWTSAAAGVLGILLAALAGWLIGRRAVQPLARALTLQRRFVTDASHELRTPLTSIRGFAELFRAGAAEDPETLARVMRRIEDEAKRMGLLVEDLLLLARLDQQRPLERTPVDLVALASDAVHDAGAVDPGRPLTLAIPEHLVVLGDEMRLRQVVGNLVTNALRHTPEGTPVTVRLAAGDGEAVLEVSDAGPGLAPDVAERVFERFYRVDPSRTRAQGVTKGGGSGLGLSIVAAVVAAHGGRVDLETTPGEGATFRVSLPLPGPGALPAATAGVLPADH